MSLSVDVGATAATLPHVPPDRPTAGAAVEKLRALAHSELPEEALETALRVVLGVGGAGAGALCLFDARQETLRLAAEHGLSDAGCKMVRSIKRGDGESWDMPLRSLLNNRAYLVENTRRGKHVPFLVEGPPHTTVVACIPLYGDGFPLGSLLLLSIDPATLKHADVQALAAPLRELAALIQALRRRAEGERGRGSAPQPERAEPEVGKLREALAAAEATVSVKDEEKRRLEDELAAARAQMEEARRRADQLLAVVETLRRQYTATQTAGPARSTPEAEPIADTLRVAAAPRVEAESPAAPAEQATVAVAPAAASVAMPESSIPPVTEVAANGAAASDAASAASVASIAPPAPSTAEPTAAAAEPVASVAEPAPAEPEPTVAAPAPIDVAPAVTVTAPADTAPVVGVPTPVEAAALVTTPTPAEPAQPVATPAPVDAAPAVAIAAPAETTPPVAAPAPVDAAPTVAITAPVETAPPVATPAPVDAAPAVAITAPAEAASPTLVEPAPAVTVGAPAEATSAVAAPAPIEPAPALAMPVPAEAAPAVTPATPEAAETAPEPAAPSGAAAAEAAVPIAAPTLVEPAVIAPEPAAPTTAPPPTEATTTVAASPVAEPTPAPNVATPANPVSPATPTSEPAPTSAAPDSSAGAAMPAAPAAPTATPESSPSAPAPSSTDVAPPADAPASAAAPPPAAVDPGVAPEAVVLDHADVWNVAAFESNYVLALAPEAAAEDQRCGNARRVVVNLAAPGSVEALARLALKGAHEAWACIAVPDRDELINVGRMKPVCYPVDPEAVAASFERNELTTTRVLAIASNVDTVLALRKTLSDRGASVSIAWSAKQALDLIPMLRPQIAIVELAVALREGADPVVLLARSEKPPTFVFLPGEADASRAFGVQLGLPANADLLVARRRWLARILRGEGGS